MARNMANARGWQLLSASEGFAPQAYAIFSWESGSTMCGDRLCGHTGIIVGVEGDTIITVETSCGGWSGQPGPGVARVFRRSLNDFVTRNATFAHIPDAELTIGGF